MLWSKRGLPPSWLDERTPHEVLFLFGESAENATEAPAMDPVAELRRLNHEKLAPKGTAPITPGWLLPKVPRVRSHQP